jgi:hypothetical protein
MRLIRTRFANFEQEVKHVRFTATETEHERPGNSRGGGGGGGGGAAAVDGAIVVKPHASPQLAPLEASNMVGGLDSVENRMELIEGKLDRLLAHLATEKAPRRSTSASVRLPKLNMEHSHRIGRNRTAASDTPAEAAAASHGTPTETELVVPRLLHVIWIKPSSAERGSPSLTTEINGSLRALDSSISTLTPGVGNRTLQLASSTGCCDTSVELSLRSYLFHYPKHKVILWTRGSWDAVAFLEARGLGKSLIEVRAFTFDSVVPEMPGLVATAAMIERVVPFTELMRYCIMYKYGGSYVDLNAIAVAPQVPCTRDLADGSGAGCCLVNISPAATKPGTGLVCSLQPKGNDCIISNDFYLNFPSKHPFFSALMQQAVDKADMCKTSLFCYGTRPSPYVGGLSCIFETRRCYISRQSHRQFYGCSTRLWVLGSASHFRALSSN